MYFQILFALFVLASTHALYNDDPFVTNLSSNNFNELVTKSKSVWIVEFYAFWCGECQKFSKQFSQTAQAFEGMVKFGSVNGEDNVELVQEHDVGGYPTIMVFNGPKGLPQIYTDKREVQALTSFITVTIHALVSMKLDGALNPAMFKTKLTEDLTEGNFQNMVLKSKKMWLVVIYTRSSSECTDLSKQWTDVEEELSGIIKVGSLDAVANYFTAGECKLFGYPTIKFFPRGMKKINLGITYTGKYTASDIVEWAFSTAAETNQLPRIVQITNNVAMEEACTKKRLCIIAFFPQGDFCDDICQNDYLTKLKTLKLEFKKHFWGWAWSEGNAQPTLEEALRINNVYPCFVAINLRTSRYAVTFDSFTMENVTGFLRNVSKSGVSDLLKKILKF